uniref:Vacuolar protein sorting-associated protein 54 n=1 Tax=Glossina brevipalpis TaxID=37001 RepID=A0A1A9W025_9MUSC
MAAVRGAQNNTTDTDANFAESPSEVEVSANPKYSKFTEVSKYETISWESCYYCPCLKFGCVSDFVKHLRERHCTREGGSFVCRYGFNGVCPSLPLDGVSDRDYDAHVNKYHVNQNSREMPPEWSVFSAAQNLPAVLNDPLRGKQLNLFTKKWGGDFVEKIHIPSSKHLPEIAYQDFEKYISKIGKRYRRHDHFTMQQNSNREGESLKCNGIVSTSPTHVVSLAVVPEIFLKETLNLQNASTFSQVFPGIMEKSNGEERRKTGRVVQEKLSHYLDIVEVKIAQQVSQKSVSFFHAMTSQDAIMTEMQEAARRVQALRAALRRLHKSVVIDTFRVLCFAKRRQNFEDVLDKLCLMATVHKTQPMLQLLLGTQDYVAALDLIATTQEILTQELIGVHCFKHLPMQLEEMEKLIDKMLTSEFVRYVTGDLNRPLSDMLKETDSTCAEEDKLVCIVMGLLRKKNFNFVDTYKDEAIVTIRAIIKQQIIEFISRSETEICLTGTGEEVQDLSISEWISLLGKVTVALLTILERVKAVTMIMRQTTTAAAGGSNHGIQSMGVNNETAVNLIDSEAFLTESDQEYVDQKLIELLEVVCQYCHERCANLVASQSLEKATATAEEIHRLALLVEEFSDGCEDMCGIPTVPLKMALKVQASRFAKRFHNERKEKLALLLDAERWLKVDIPNEFQKLIDIIGENGISALTVKRSSTNFLTGEYSYRHCLETTNNPPASPLLLVESVPYTLVGSVLLLVQMLCEYCWYGQYLPIVAGYLSRNVVDLLRTFNSRSCQLVIGAGALSVAGLKTITSTNLALLSRALQLILWLLPKIKDHFQSLDSTSVGGYEAVEKDYHGHIREIENKIYTIVQNCVASELDKWDARPPIPSNSFRLILRHLVRLHEAIGHILPEKQMQTIYSVVHRNFKDKLREQLLRLKIANNGGPQHGVVTSELTFYMETLETLKALPPEEHDDDILENIWDF